MKTLHLNIEQAQNLGNDLIEYSKMKDSSDRKLFIGFKISFGDLHAQGVYDDTITMTPMPDFTEINSDK